MDRVAGIRANGFVATKRTASWLGFGNYFFLEAPGHCTRWAQDAALRPTRTGPGVVIKAKINLAGVINLLDNEYWDIIQSSYEGVSPDKHQVGPGYRYDPDFQDHDSVGRNFRDCEAMNAFVARLVQDGIQVPSIIAAFSEGDPVDKDSWLFDESHVAINVLDATKIEILEYFEV